MSHSMYGAGVKDQGSVKECEGRRLLIAKRAKRILSISGIQTLHSWGVFRNIIPIILPPTSTPLKGRCDTRML